MKRGQAYPPKGKSTSERIVRAINELQAALVEEYGVDYAYTIAGKGQIVAAHNLTSGEVAAQARAASSPIGKQEAAFWDEVANASDQEIHEMVEGAVKQHLGEKPRHVK